MLFSVLRSRLNNVFQFSKTTVPRVHPAWTASIMPKRAKATSKADGGEDAPVVASDSVKSPARSRSRSKSKPAAAEEVTEGTAAAAEPTPQTKPKQARKPKAAAAEKEVAATKQAPEVEEAGDEAAAAKPAKKARKSKAPEPERVVYSEALRPPAPEGPTFKVLSWNVAGLRGLLKKHPKFLAPLLEREAPDVICLQETKVSDAQATEVLKDMGVPSGWAVHWCCSQDKAGYSGVATLSRTAPLSVSQGFGHKDHDGEGRVLVTEYDKLFVVNTYTPNSGEGLKRLDYRVGTAGWDETLAQHVRELQKRKPVVLAGDLNCAHQEIDIARPKTNLRSAGFTQEERDSFGTRLLGPSASGGAGLVDVLRAQHPDVVAYTYYSYRFNCRAKGIGWRLDYCLTSPELAGDVHDAFILPDVMGSDHVPLGVTLKV